MKKTVFCVSLLCCLLLVVFASTTIVYSEPIDYIFTGIFETTDTDPLGLNGASFKYTAYTDSAFAPINFGSANLGLSTEYYYTTYGVRSKSTLTLSNAGSLNGTYEHNGFVSDRVYLSSPVNGPPVTTRTDALQLASMFDIGRPPGMEVFVGVYFDDNDFLKGTPLQLPLFSSSDAREVDAFASYVIPIDINPDPDAKVNLHGSSMSATSSPVPEPTTMLLFGAGLVGLAGFGRKKFKK